MGRSKIANQKSQIKNPESGFTLTELVIVIGIAAILTAITVPSFNRVSESNRIMGCQVNLHAMYQSIKMYRLDEAGFPPYDPTSSADDTNGLGLWALHVYGPRESVPGGTNDYSLKTTNQTARYIRGVKQLHCPDQKDPKCYSVDPNRYTDPANSSYFNYPYLSYQFQIPKTGQPWSDATRNPDQDQYTYDVYRGATSTNPADADYLGRQLAPPPSWTQPLSSWYPSDNTVITWCPHHRQYQSDAQDLVLFMDGSVQSLPVKETGTSCNGLVGWQRKPSRECQ